IGRARGEGKGESQRAGPTFKKKLQALPLRGSNWENANGMPLQLDALTITCAIKTAEQRLMEHDNVTAALITWAPGVVEETEASNARRSHVTPQVARTRCG